MKIQLHQPATLTNFQNYNNVNFNLDKHNTLSRRIQSSSTYKKPRVTGNSNEIFLNDNDPLCPKLLIKEKILLENKIHNHTNNLCYDDCSNIPLIKKYEHEIKELVEANINLKKMNEYLIKTLNLKDDLLIHLSRENKNLKINNNILNSHVHSKRIFSGKPIKIKDNSKAPYISECCVNIDSVNPEIGKSSKIRKAMLIDNFYKENNKFAHASNFKAQMPMSQNRKKEMVNLGYKSFKLINKFDEFISLNEKKPLSDNEENKELNLKISSTKNKDNYTCLLKNPILKSHSLYESGKKTYKNIRPDANNIHKSFNFYEKLSGMINKTSKNIKNKSKTRSSLLSLTDDKLSELLSNEIFVNLNKITANDEDFINFFKNSSEEFLINYCDGIYSIVKDLESAIKLVQRMRNYIRITATLINCVLVEELANLIIKDACQIMDCDRASIFIYDNISDMLVVHTAVGVQRNDIKIPKNFGIIGYCFLKGEIIRVDDAYSDSRFNKEFDNKSNYITKTLLAAPLKDINGVTYGVIQAINKNNNLKFTDDDEEIIHLFALQISQIMKNANANDENVTYIAKLKMIISFRDEIEKIKNLVDLTVCLEEIVTNIFSAQCTQMLFVNQEKSALVHFAKYEKREKNGNLGIVGHVLESKEYIGVNSSNSCTFYNNIVDIETAMAILTYPVISKNKIVAILQFSYNDKLVHFKRPKENDEQIINYVLADCKKWLNNNEDVLGKEIR